MNKQLLLAPVYGYAEDCNYPKDYSFSVDSTSLKSLQLDVSAGKLIVTENSASNEVRVVTTACVDSSRRLEELDLAHHVLGFELRVLTQRYLNGGIFSWLSWGNFYSYIGIEVTMPSDLILDDEDGSGGIEITNVSSLLLSDGYGSIQIEEISDNVESGDTGPGSVDVCGVAGIYITHDD